MYDISFTIMRSQILQRTRDVTFHISLNITIHFPINDIFKEIQVLLILGRAKDQVMAEANVLYSNDPGLLTEVISAFPKTIESTLNLYKSKLLANIKGWFWSYNFAL